MAQGLPLDAAAPPLGGHEPASRRGGGSQDDPGALLYEGAEPLDLALADRFAFVLQVPVLGQLSEEDQQAVLAGGGRADPRRAGDG